MTALRVKDYLVLYSHTLAYEKDHSHETSDYQVDKFKEVLGWMNDFVADDKFAAGTSQMTIADISLLATYSTIKAADIAGVDLAEYANTEAWFNKCCKLVPNYEKANGEGAAAFGGFYKSKC